MGHLNPASTIVVLFGVTVPKHYLKNYRLQNQVARILTQSSYDADANQLIKKLGLDNLETWGQKLKAEMVHKSLNGLMPWPRYLSSKFIPRGDMITFYNLYNSENKVAIPLPQKIALATVVQSSGAVCLQLSGKQHL